MTPLVLITVLASAPAAAPAVVNPFDGAWATTVACAASRDALGYSFYFLATVKDGHYAGLQGVEGQPSSLKIEGEIGPGGDAELTAHGRTGSKEFVPGRDTPRGTDYAHTIKAHFDAKTGHGERLQGRPCTLRFEKQK